MTFTLAWGTQNVAFTGPQQEPYQEGNAGSFGAESGKEFFTGKVYFGLTIPDQPFYVLCKFFPDGLGEGQDVELLEPRKQPGSSYYSGYLNVVWNQPGRFEVTFNYDESYFPGETVLTRLILVMEKNAVGAEGGPALSLFQWEAVPDTLPETTPPNEPPTANPDSATTAADTPVVIDVLANDTDSDGTIPGGMYGVVISSQGSKGLASVNVDGTVTYAPYTGATGVDTFYYQCYDNSDALSAPAAVTVTIEAGASVAPVANPDSASTPYETNVLIPVLDNDVDSDGTMDRSSVTIAMQGVKGTATAVVEGDIVYAPLPGESGTDYFTYQVANAAGAFSEPATVTVVIGEKPEQPTEPGELALAWGSSYPGTPPSMEPYLQQNAGAIVPYIDENGDSLSGFIGGSAAFSTAPSASLSLRVTHLFYPLGGGGPFVDYPYVDNGVGYIDLSVDNPGLHEVTATTADDEPLPNRLVISVSPKVGGGMYGGLAWYQEELEPVQAQFWTAFLKTKEVP
ncbi:Ig-like domain-containing protein [Comamonas sp. lk]|uniref:Ig-like domain-containing protein n=1 Tax=Comamonas sp. lk TaxID=2201272 RepID=UPI000EB2D8BE|nr:Ig-like domain-containing protein [Comamonas sp. lk]